MITSRYSLRQAADDMSGITQKGIDLQRLLQVTQFPETGGTVLFTGQIRNHNEGKAVKQLAYTFHPTLANKLLKDTITDCYQKFDIHAAVCIHRVGMLDLTDVAVAILTMSAHRKEAYEANQYLIDTIKHKVPIWKKEYYTDNTYSWPTCNHQH